MKRTLFEILCGLTVVVMMVSFHQRISRLRADNDSLADLRETVARSSSKIEIEGARKEILDQVSDRLAMIQGSLESAQENAANATFLREQLEATRREASLLRAELTRDVQRNKELIDTYQDEMRVCTKQTRERIGATQRGLDRITGTLMPDPNALNTELIAPTVQLNGDDTVGSGTLIRSSQDRRTGRAENYVLTSYHVVRNILADSPRAKTEGIAVTVYDGDDRTEVRGALMSFDADIDAALIKLDTDQIFRCVARVLPRDRVNEVRVWDSIYAIGCPLGNDPIPTTGELCSRQNVLNGTNYWMINAPTYYGNSGGGIYLADGNYLIGVFSKIYTHGKGNPIVVPHMGLCTPITSIYEWLDRESLAHVVGEAKIDAVAAQPPK